MNLIERAKNILVSPKTEWEAIAADPTPTPALVAGYVLPLAAVTSVAAFIGIMFLGQGLGPPGTTRSPVEGLGGLALQLAMSVAMVFALGFIIDALAPAFGAEKNMGQAVKVAAYAYTPVWLVGILAIIPALGLLGSILAAFYAVYLVYLGLPRLMKSPAEKSVAYTAVVVIAAFVLALVLGVGVSMFAIR